MPRYLSLVLGALALITTTAGHAAELTGFAEPRAGLHTGGQPDAAQLQAFAQDGGAVVIDLRAPDEDRGYDEAAAAQQLGLRYVRLPIAGAAALTAANASALQRALAEAGGPVLLHCASGNRVGALLALEAAQHEGLDAAAALALGQRAGLKSLEPVVRERLGLGHSAGP